MGTNLEALLTGVVMGISLMVFIVMPLKNWIEKQIDED